MNKIAELWKAAGVNLRRLSLTAAKAVDKITLGPRFWFHVAKQTYVASRAKRNSGKFLCKPHPALDACSAFVSEAMLGIGVGVCIITCFEGLRAFNATVTSTGFELGVAIAAGLLINYPVTRINQDSYAEHGIYSSPGRPKLEGFDAFPLTLKLLERYSRG